MVDRLCYLLLYILCLAVIVAMFIAMIVGSMKLVAMAGLGERAQGFVAGVLAWNADAITGKVIKAADRYRATRMAA